MVRTLGEELLATTKKVSKDSRSDAQARKPRSASEKFAENLRKVAAKENLVEIERIRAVAAASQSGMSQREIADLLDTSQPDIHRVLRRVNSGSGIPEVSPNEVVMRATVGEISRKAMLDALRNMDYSIGQSDPTGGDGYLAGTWDQVKRLVGKHFVTESEYERLRLALRERGFDV